MGRYVYVLIIFFATSGMYAMKKEDSSDIENQKRQVKKIEISKNKKRTNRQTQEKITTYRQMEDRVAELDFSKCKTKFDYQKVIIQSRRNLLRITPRALAECWVKHNPLPSKTPKGWEVKRLEEIKENDKEMYKKLVENAYYKLHKRRNGNGNSKSESSLEEKNKNKSKGRKAESSSEEGKVSLNKFMLLKQKEEWDLEKRRRVMERRQKYITMAITALSLIGNLVQGYIQGTSGASTPFNGTGLG